MTQSSLTRATGSFPPTLGKEQPFLRHFNRTKCHYNVGIDNESIRNQHPKSLLSSCKVIAQQSGLLERCLGMWLWFKLQKKGRMILLSYMRISIAPSNLNSTICYCCFQSYDPDLVPFLSYSTRLKISLAPMFMPMFCCTSSPKDHQL